MAEPQFIGRGEEWPHLQPFPVWKGQQWGWVGLRPPRVEVPS